MKRVGLVPAAGSANRIAPLPCSKEIFPVGYGNAGGKGGRRPRVACQSLLEKMATAGAKTAFIVTRPDKWDIPAYLGSGKGMGVGLAYIMTDPTPGAPYTLDQAFPFVNDALILFGFPDIVFDPDDAFLRLLGRQAETDADIVLGLYRASRPHKMDMVALDPSGRIREIVIKPGATDLTHTWIIAVWTPVFTRFMNGFLAAAQAADKRPPGELHVGDVVRTAISQGVRAETVVFEDGRYVDIGTPEDLYSAVRENIQSLETENT